MSKVSADMSISLDGFIAGPNDNEENPLGEGGEELHEWAYELASFREMHGREGGETNRDDEVMREAFEGNGAVLMGRRMFDLGEQPWGDEPPFHAPVFVVTHREREELAKEGAPPFTSSPTASRARWPRQKRRPARRTSRWPAGRT